jgi:hypothetical protein
MTKRIYLGIATILFSARAVLAAEPNYVAHEWGTFTSVQGGDGIQLQWQAFQSSELPEFVYSWRKPSLPGRLLSGGPVFGKGDLLAVQRMETPVIYFRNHTGRDLNVNVSVGFPQGKITEWYPQANQVGPAITNNGVNTTESRITWNGVRISASRKSAGEDSLPADKSGSHYYSARETDADVLEVDPGFFSRTEREKFLFYRGVGYFQTPLKINMASDNSVILSNTAVGDLDHLFILNVKGGAGSFTHLNRLKTGENAVVPLDSSAPQKPVADLMKDISGEMAVPLSARGLFPDEAAAMVKTWGDSWFGEEGIRVLYLLPEKWADSVIPLSLSPKPQQLIRVMVGRAEIISPAVEHRLRDEWTRGNAGNESARLAFAADLKSLGRFGDAAMRLAMKNPTEAAAQSTLQFE